MEQHPIGDLMASTMSKIREMVDVNTIIGQAIQTEDGITLIPVSKVSFGFGGGGSDFQTKQQQPNQSNAFGGGIGAGVNIQPVAFLIVKDGNVRLVHVSPPENSVIDKAIDLAPEVLQKISELINKNKEKDAE
jgi:sporulation protein YtfJ